MGFLFSLRHGQNKNNVDKSCRGKKIPGRSDAKPPLEGIPCTNDQILMPGNPYIC